MFPTKQFLLFHKAESKIGVASGTDDLFPIRVINSGECSVKFESVILFVTETVSRIILASNRNIMYHRKRELFFQRRRRLSRRKKRISPQIHHTLQFLIKAIESI